ncbi:hypothetical protein DFH07DRAFT_680841, partial [Mycena maculata]
NVGRVEITLNPRIPPKFVTTLEKKDQWVDGFLKSIVKDVKHSGNWRCEFCTKRARETEWMDCPWLHFYPPRMVSYVHSVCDTEGPCA